jgi:hypothetical protein
LANLHLKRPVGQIPASAAGSLQLGRPLHIENQDVADLREDQLLYLTNSVSGVAVTGRSTMEIPLRIAYSTVYRVPPAVPLNAAINSEE